MSQTDKPVSYQPTDGLSYDPDDARYWDAAGLQKEVTRVFEVCHGCRMCFKYCDSFPVLFDLIDKRHDGDVRKLTAPETDRVIDSCFQCKLCEVQCPYTPRDKHEYQLDFPKLVHRYKAQRTKARGVPLRDRLLANADAAGTMARLSFGMANVMNRVTLVRAVMHAAVGIHKDKLLPDFAPTTFEKWAERNARVQPRPEGVEAVLFPTCYVQNNEPQIGRDTLEVMDRNQVKTACVKGLQCCGMPAWETGDIETVRKQAANNLKVLKPFVDAGVKVIAINPTCAMMMRREYPELLPEALRPEARRLAELVRDPSEFLWRSATSPASTPTSSRPPAAGRLPRALPPAGAGGGLQGAGPLAEDPGRAAEADHGVLRSRRHLRHEGRGFREQHQGGAEGLRRDEGGEGRGVGHRLPARGPAVPAARGQEALHPMSILARAYRRTASRRRSRRERRRRTERRNEEGRAQRDRGLRDLRGAPGSGPRVGNEGEGARRVHVGPHLTFLFENHETIHYQVQEMMRAERMVKEAEIVHEMETYNELLGGPGEIGCSLLVELDDPAERAEEAHEVARPAKHLYVTRADGTKAYARYDERQVGDTRVSSVST